MKQTCDHAFPTPLATVTVSLPIMTRSSGDSFPGRTGGQVSGGEVAVKVGTHPGWFPAKPTLRISQGQKKKNFRPSQRKGPGPFCPEHRRRAGVWCWRARDGVPMAGAASSSSGSDRASSRMTMVWTSGEEGTDAIQAGKGQISAATAMCGFSTGMQRSPRGNV